MTLILLSIGVCLWCLTLMLATIIETHREITELTRQLHDAQWKNVQLERQLAAQPVLPVVGRKGRWVS